jgi:hypothetical protein
MESTGPDPAQEAGKPEHKEGPPPPGVFLSPDLASDTARFLAELKNRLRRRAEATPPVELGPPEDKPSSHRRSSGKSAGSEPPGKPSEGA